MKVLVPFTTAIFIDFPPNAAHEQRCTIDGVDYEYDATLNHWLQITAEPSLRAVAFPSPPILDPMRLATIQTL